MSESDEISRLLVVSERAAIHRLVDDTFAYAGSQVAGFLAKHATTASEALSAARVDRPRAALVDVSLGNGAGLGLVHFLPATVPGLVVLAVVPEVNDAMRLAEQAGALGASWVFTGELTGDDILSAVHRLCPRTSEPTELIAPQLPEIADFDALDGALERMAQTTLSDSFREIAEQLRETVRRCIAADRSNRATIQDAATSAYSFAYFVDLAGRQIDLSRRHGRRFGLVSVELRDTPTEKGVELVLSSVRDTDIVARADDQELLVLLPETNAAGARTLRRRIMERARATAPALSLEVGLATYPVDGDDLSRLLRTARRRAQRWSVLDAKGTLMLAQAIEWLRTWERGKSFVWGEAPNAGEVPYLVPLEMSLREAWAFLDVLVREATRGGDATLALHASLSGNDSPIGLAQGVRAATNEGPMGSAPPAHRREMPKNSLTLITGESRLAQGCDVPGLEVITLVAEHASYVLIGSVVDGRLRALHSHDLPIADIILRGLDRPVVRRSVMTRSTSSIPPGSSNGPATDPMWW